MEFRGGLYLVSLFPRHRLRIWGTPATGISGTHVMNSMPLSAIGLPPTA